MMSGNVPALPLAFFLLLVFSLSPSASAFALQGQITGGVAGTVRDQTGALIVEARVMVTSNATHEQRTVTTDRDGYFVVPFLPPGSYQVSVSQRGFKNVVFDNVVVAI